MIDHPVLAAAHALCAVLDEENAALHALDVPRAIALVGAKQAAADALLKAQAHGSPAATAASLALAERLQLGATTNKRLLERAIAAQNRVMACIARAVPKAAERGGRYRATGTAVQTSLTPAVAFRSQA